MERMEAHNSVERLIEPGSKVLYLFFGGIQAGIGMPPFEFYKASGIINENKIFLRDFSQSWYHAGLHGISSDIDSTALYIENVIDEIGPEKIYFVGNSMGGYAAMLFHVLLAKGEAIAFAPQTFISSELREKYGDDRWPEQISRTLGLPATKTEVHDLGELILKRKPACKISIFVAGDNPLDLVHATHVRECAGVHVYEFDAGGHQLVKELRNEGKLAQIMLGQYV